MARVKSQRQKNKPFKAKSKGAKQKNSGKATTKTKNIAKPKGRTRNTRSKLVSEAKQKKIQQVQKINTKNQYLDQMTKSAVVSQLKTETDMKIIVVFQANKQADTNNLINQIYTSLSQTEGLSLQTKFQCIPFPVLQIIPTGKSFIKHKLTIISSEHKNKGNISESQYLQSLMDIIKCADIICPVLSCKSTDVQQMQLDPHEKGGAFDEKGYAILNMVRSLGTPTIIGIVQHLNIHDLKNHDKIQRLFKRFINSELGQNYKINYLKGNQHQINKLLRQMDNTTPEQQPWKNQRGYMLVQDVTVDAQSGNLTFHGYLKGNCVHANQLVHVTGQDDYQIQKIQIRSKRNKNNEANLVQYSTSPQSLFAFSKKQEISDDILSGLSNLQVSQSKQNIPNQMKEEQRESDFEDQPQDELQQQNIDEYFSNNKQQQKTKRIQMQMRKEDQLQFQDEVQYAAEQSLREKYKDYQGLKNFKTSQWNTLQNLPDQYDRIYTFKHYNRTHQNVLTEQQSKGFAYPNFFISVTIKGFSKDKILQKASQSPTIITFLLKHQRKMTQIHLKVRRNPFYSSNENCIKSNQNYSISLGFRRFVVRPIFSRVIPGTQKTKFIKKIGQDYQSYFYCSFYYYNYFPPAPVQIYQVNQLNHNERQISPIMYGTIAKCDPLHIVLQRIILAGYPFKINKRRSTVRFMFFNPKDVKYFQPVQVRTKMGLKGRIQQSLGTHGYMKILFNDKIKHDDTVCMSLYRRVFPQPNF